MLPVFSHKIKMCTLIKLICTKIILAFLGMCLLYCLECLNNFYISNITSCRAYVTETLCMTCEKIQACRINLFYFFCYSRLLALCF